MIELFKVVLNGVAEDKQLFEKELKKALSWMKEDEKRAFKIWVKEHFYSSHREVINEAFYPYYHTAS